MQGYSISVDPSKDNISRSKNPKEYSTIIGVGSDIPVQIEAYFLALNKYTDENAKILDIGPD